VNKDSLLPEFLVVVGLLAFGPQLLTAGAQLLNRFTASTRPPRLEWVSTQQGHA
jgi:hypothetical protein